MLLTEAPNIFRGAQNDYNIRVMKCKHNSISIDNYVRQVASIISQEWGHDPFKNQNSRTRERVMARQMFLVFCYNNGRNGSLAVIGKYMNKDHATVCHAQKTIQNLLDTDKQFKEIYESIEEKVKLIIL